MVFYLKFTLNVSEDGGLQVLIGLLQKSLKIVASILFVSSGLFFYFLLFLSLVTADGETNLPTFVLLRACLSENHLCQGGLIHNCEVLRVFAPPRVLFHISFLLTVVILLNLDSSRSSCKRLTPDALDGLLNGLWQFHNVDGVRSKYSEVKFPDIIFFEGFFHLFGVVDIRHNDENSIRLFSLF